jgi:hypothetical protein
VGFAASMTGPQTGSEILRNVGKILPDYMASHHVKFTFFGTRISNLTNLKHLTSMNTSDSLH